MKRVEKTVEEMEATAMTVTEVLEIVKNEAADVVPAALKSYQKMNKNQKVVNDLTTGAKGIYSYIKSKVTAEIMTSLKATATITEKIEILKADAGLDNLETRYALGLEEATFKAECAKSTKPEIKAEGSRVTGEKKIKETVVLPEVPSTIYQAPTLLNKTERIKAGINALLELLKAEYPTKNDDELLNLNGFNVHIAKSYAKYDTLFGKQNEKIQASAVSVAKQAIMLSKNALI